MSRKIVIVFAALAASAPNVFASTSGLTENSGYWSVDRIGTLTVWEQLDRPGVTYSLSGDEDRYAIRGVGDDGSRVLVESTSEDSTIATFRAPDGNILGQVPITITRPEQAAALGTALYWVESRDNEWNLLKVTPDLTVHRVLSQDRATIVDQVGVVPNPSIDVSPAGIVLVFYGFRGTAYRIVGRDDLVVVNGVASCTNRIYDRVFPRHEGRIARIAKVYGTNMTSPFDTSIRLETLDRNGRRLANVALDDAYREIHPTMNGGLLLRTASGMIHVGADDQVVETKPLPAASEAHDTAAIASLADQLGKESSETSGRAWAQLALLGAERDLLDKYADVPLRDPVGAIDRLALVGDDDELRDRAESAFLLIMRWLYRMQSSGSQDSEGVAASVMATINRSVGSGGPEWLRREAAIPTLHTLGDEAPAWVRSTLLENWREGRELRGAPPDLTDAVFARHIVAADCERLAMLDRNEPEAVARILEQGASDPSFVEYMLFGSRDQELAKVAKSMRFHAPDGLVRDAILTCAEGAGPAGMMAVSRTLAAPAFRLMRLPDGCPAGEKERLEAAFDATRAALESAHSDDGTVQAVVQVLSPVFDLPVDPGSWRRAVLVRPSLLDLAVRCLRFEEALPDDEWLALFNETAVAFKKLDDASGHCWDSDDDDAMELLVAETSPITLAELRRIRPRRNPVRPWCSLMNELEQLVVRGTVLPRDELLIRWASGEDATEEVHRRYTLSLSLAGRASLDELLTIWRSPDLPGWYRQDVLLVNVDALLDTVLEELATGSHTPEQRAMIVTALKMLRPEDPRVAELVEQPLEEKLQPHLIALQRLRASDLDAAQPVLDAILAGRLTVYSGRYTPADPLNGPEELARLFEPLDKRGVSMLLELYHALPDGPAGDVLLAIRELEPDVVRPEAEKRLRDRLDDTCVDQHALKTLLREGQRKFPQIEAALVEKGCQKDQIVWPQGEDLGSLTIKRALEDATDDPACREAIKDLFAPNF